MRAHILGVRGSRPAPGPDYVRYGGNTSCVAVSHDDGPVALVLDAGTGLTQLTARLDGAPFSGALLLTHLHWDHVLGLPFFEAGDRRDARVALYLPAQGDDPVQVLSRSMGPPHFPITPTQLRGSWTFRGLQAGTHTIEGFTVEARDIPHKGGRTFGYRVSDGDRSLVYMPDHGPIERGEGPDGLGERHRVALDLADRSDLVIHDAQYTVSEFPAVRDYGHSTIDYAVSFAAQAHAARLLLFHHDPSRTDADLDEIAARVATIAPAGLRVDVAREGLTIDLPA